jgi:hypothetical protein
LLSTLRFTAVVGSGVLAVGLATLLVTAGTIKTVNPRYATGSLFRVIRPGVPVQRMNRHPGAVRLAVRVLGAVECGTGTALLWSPRAVRVPVAVAAAGLFTGFVAVTWLARRRGSACGCWGSLSDGPAGAGELGRRIGLAVASVVLVLLRAWPAARGTSVGPAVLLPVLVLAVGAGILLASERPRPMLRRWFGAATVGVHRPVAATRPVPARIRRRILARLRVDPTVRAVTAVLLPHGELDWTRAVVTAPRATPLTTSRMVEPTATGATRQALVSVPGTGVAVRIVVSGGHEPTVIGETPYQILLGRAGRVTAVPKNAETAPATR